ncbi:protein BOBBER 1-like [Durio zibethinus]|uniref:Protein BOBBER 1-like n=1 Tax=Durio zibethinus TaxID=66656 RepID=A0A6P5Y7T3_DURZI|nr:protein BOBBER 1-like [Durio zibethinus]
MGFDDPNEPKSSTSPVAFSSVFDPSNPMGFFESAFNFASQTTDIFNDSQGDEMETKILSLLEEIKKRKREKKGELEEDDEKKRLRLEADGNDDTPSDDDLLTPNKSNGLDMENYSWTQTLGAIEVQVPVPFGTKMKLVVCDIKSKALRVGVKGQPMLIDGELFQAVKVCESFWSLEDHDTVTILLSKRNQWEWWKSVVKGDPEIDTRKCQPGVRRLDGLGYEAERHMRKLLFDYGQKCKGLPTSEDSSEVLKKFITHHPYLNLPQTNS